MCFLCGCSSNTKVDGEEKEKRENIEKIKINYCVDVKKAIRNRIEIDVEDDNSCIYYKDNVNNIDYVFAINDVDMIVRFVKESILESDSSENDNREQGQLEEQLILWDIDVNTNINTYYFEGFEEFPTYWEQLWAVLVSATDAKDKTDFGLQE